jgi:ferrochelatase
VKLVTGGRGVPPEVVHELQERYAQIGLGDERSAESPHLTRWTLRQAALLEGRLGKTVYVGMRNWEPFIGKVVEGMKRDGITRARAICLAPQNSRTSVGLYKRAIEDAARRFHGSGVYLWMGRSPSIGKGICSPDESGFE